MISFNLIKTEKSYNLEANNTYTLTVTGDTKINKVVLNKILTSLKLKVESINSTKQYGKIKRRGKKFTLVRKLKPRKFYIKLKPGETLTEEILSKYNQKS